MFIGAEARLTVGFGQARARLANLVRGGLLGRASEGAYDEWRTALVRDGPWGTAPWGAVLAMSRLARVQVRDAVARGDLAIWPLRWEVTGPPGALVPVLDADIKLIPAGADAAMLAVSAVCRPQLAGLDTGLDQMITRRCAQATIQAFTHRIAAAVMHPAGPSGARHHWPTMV
ncbi:MAG TPA: hypothetical protein VEF71_06380 [Streptosporangiaceae bacterium]|nr:hypothetical protein [Streptosporangiaceae bacterium]